MKHLSHSSLTCADECLKKFNLTRLSEVDDRLPSLPAKPRDVGILAHRLIEAHFLSNSAPEAVIEALSDQDRTEHFAEAWSMLQNWKKNFNVPEECWLFSERDGSCNVEGVPVPIIGYDDFVYNDNGVHVLRDFKTGWGTEVYDSYSFQGDLACLRYEQEYPGVPLASEVEFVRRGLVSPRREWTDELRAATIARVQALWLKILNAEREKAYPATPGRHCGFCPYSTTCSEARRVADAHLVIIDKASADAARGEIELMQTALKTMRAALKSYCGENPE